MFNFLFQVSTTSKLATTLAVSKAMLVRAVLDYQGCISTFGEVPVPLDHGIFFQNEPVRPPFYLLYILLFDTISI